MQFMYVLFAVDVTETNNLSGVHFTFDPLCSLVSSPYNPLVRVTFFMWQSHDHHDHHLQAEKAVKVYIRDISGGKERVPVSVCALA